MECPSAIVDPIGGWKTSGVGHGYGNGYPLEVLGNWMKESNLYQNGKREPCCSGTSSFNSLPSATGTQVNLGGDRPISWRSLPLF